MAQVMETIASDAGSASEPVDAILTHFAILLQVGDNAYYILERRSAGVIIRRVVESEVEHRKVGSEARVTSPLHDIWTSVKQEAGREFVLTTNNCRNFAANFYSRFCDTGEKRNVKEFIAWAEAMPRTKVRFSGSSGIDGKHKGGLSGEVLAGNSRP